MSNENINIAISEDGKTITLSQGDNRLHISAYGYEKKLDEIYNEIRFQKGKRHIKELRKILEGED